MKPVFKKSKTPTTRLERVAYKPSWDIYIKKVLIGQITPDLRVMFKVIKDDFMNDDNVICPWTWMTLNYRPTSFEQAKEFIEEKMTVIASRHKLYFEKKQS